MTHALVYDADCGFCTRCADWLAARSDLDVVAWQSLDLAAVGLTEAQVKEAAYWLEDGRPVDRASGAIARSLRACGGVAGLAGRLMMLPVVRSLAALVYPFIARNRQRLPGGTPACRMP